MPGGYRRERLQREIFRQVCLILAGEVKDPKLAMATLTRVELSPDYTFAKVLVAGVGRDAKVVQDRIARLNRARSFFAMRLNQELNLRKGIEIRFLHDKGASNVERVEAELRRLASERRKEEGRA
jgi:ribosome-binding factor A